MVPQSGHCSKVLEQFLRSNDGFLIFHSQQQLNTTRRLLVLDSSFNPPHASHYNLVKTAFQHYQRQGDELQVLLLLSINNADKGVHPATFDRRMDMMCIMGDLLRRESIKTSIGLTKFGKFVDKSKVIQTSLGEHFKITYLVGFDTIIRVFDSKYYKPALTAEALSLFMNVTDFYCLSRKCDIPLVRQLNYPVDIANGIYEPNIPRSWSEKITVRDNDDLLSEVSSSMLRRSIFDPNVDDTPFVLPEIREYILNDHAGNNIFQ
ncbi:LADA_0H00870g1_1 [Lachancea dasiensis]|uniref:LADA_0H00870g1_1 n=1 Tax=Lachancea dasiensis TaxID=1072105 RepID=A0A1G4JYY4_9SACH|nr:LADA_0H00870g1_1 [Lachancea dasiensis]